MGPERLGAVRAVFGEHSMLVTARKACKRVFSMLERCERCCSHPTAAAAAAIGVRAVYHVQALQMEPLGTVGPILGVA